MYITGSQTSFVDSNHYLTPPSSPPRRKSPVFFLLVVVDIIALAVFVLCISRLGKEMHEGGLQTGRFKIFSITYTIAITVITILFLTLSISFFKSVYPAPPPFRSSFSALKTESKATIICNFSFSILWCSALGIQAGELWANLNRQTKNDATAEATAEANIGFSGVEGQGRFWLRIGLTAGIMLGLIALGWCSLQGVWRNKSRRNLADELATRRELSSGFD